MQTIIMTVPKSSPLFDVGDPPYVLFCTIGVIVWIAFSIWYATKRQAMKDKTEEKLISLNAIDQIKIGNHLAGLSNVRFPGVGGWYIICAVMEEFFSFFELDGEELYRIPRNSINQIIVDDRSQISRQITATRILALGIFALVAPKTVKEKAYCLVIDYDDEIGTRDNLVFQFTGPNSDTEANAAALQLKKYIKPKTIKPKPDERKCPYCAEIIKAEANLCRYCGSKLKND